MPFKELRTLGVILRNEVVGAVATLNPFAKLACAVAIHTLSTTNNIEVVEGEGIRQQLHQVTLERSNSILLLRIKHLSTFQQFQ